MPLDTSQLQFIASNPLRHGDGSYQFTVVVLNPSPILGQPADFVAKADVHVASDRVCLALAEALRHIGEQLPPELSLADMGRRN